MNGIFYFVGYLLFMIPTYVLAWGGSNSLILQSTARETGAPQAAHFQTLFFIHLACLLILCVLAWRRGAGAGKTWLVTFPALALVFDLVPILSWIPFVPTLMHLLALIVGGMATQVVVPNDPAIHGAANGHATNKPRSLAVPALLVVLALGIIGVRAMTGTSNHQAASNSQADSRAMPPPAAVPAPERHEVKLSTVTTNLAGGDRFAQVGVLAVFDSSEAADRARAGADSIQAELVAELNGSTAEALLTSSGKAKLAEAMKSRIASKLGANLGPSEVVFTSFIVQ